MTGPSGLATEDTADADMAKVRSRVVALVGCQVGRLTLRCLDAREFQAGRHLDPLEVFHFRERPGGAPVHLVERAFELVLAPTLAPSSPQITEVPEHAPFDATPTTLGCKRVGRRSADISAISR